MSKPAPLLSLIIPVYKKEKIIVANIKLVKQVLDKIRYNFEIIVVIDGLVDKSFSVLQKAKIPKTRVYAYSKNQGKGYAIRFGMFKAKGDYIMFLDSGMEINPNAISMLLEHMEWYDADIIVGSKRHPASIVDYTKTRRVLSYGYYLIVRSLFGLDVHDTQAGIKIFRKEVLKKVLPRLLEKKWCADLEMLVVAKQIGFHRIYEAPIKLNYNLGGVSSAANMKTIYGMLLDTAAIFYRAKILHFYNRKI